MNEKYNILIIDDETEILNMLSKFLNRSDKFTNTTYSNPVSALNSFDSGKYDLVLLDIMILK